LLVKYYSTCTTKAFSKHTFLKAESRKRSLFIVPVAAVHPQPATAATKRNCCCHKIMAFNDLMLQDNFLLLFLLSFAARSAEKGKFSARKTTTRI